MFFFQYVALGKSETKSIETAKAIVNVASIVSTT